MMSSSFDSFDLPAVALTLGVACLFQPGSKHMTEKHGKTDIAHTNQTQYDMYDMYDMCDIVIIVVRLRTDHNPSAAFQPAHAPVISSHSGYKLHI